jgi:glyoxylase-like metal-dependent hydrolase (beta-lactamase superfamily II)
VIVAVLGLAAQTRTETLTIYYIDTEGGQSTLFVGPTGESLLVDTGNAGDRALGRIADALRTAGVTKIDHLWTTHYHGDHVGALLELARQFPVAHFYDHGKPHPNDRIVSSQRGWKVGLQRGRLRPRLRGSPPGDLQRLLRHRPVGGRRRRRGDARVVDRDRDPSRR